MTENNLIRRNAKWYVYELIDPRDGLAFYVGKGTGNRIAAHERDASKAVGVCSQKINRIKEIWANCLSVERVHVAWFWDEQEAYNFEASRIDSYSLKALTNIVTGGGSPRSNFINRPQVVGPWSPEIAARGLVSNPKIAEWFFTWLKAKAQGGTFEIYGSKLAVSVGSASFKLFPDWWAKVCESIDAIKILEPHAAINGVRFKYGGS